MPRLRQEIIGWVGPMYSSKTLHLLDYINGAEATGRQVLVVKPGNDTRFGLDQIESRCGGRHDALAISPQSPDDMLLHVNGHQQVAIDEAQFFDPALADTIRYLSQNGIEVAYSGLNLNYRGQPFAAMKEIMPLSTRLEIVTARCMYSHNGDRYLCGHEATMTQRLVNGHPDSFNSPEVIIQQDGTDVTYQARCLDHWQVADLPQIRRI